jgi:CHAD domain-containing protein
MDEAGHMYDPERLHAVRISAKKLRYGLELAADSGLKAALPHVRAIKRVQDMLGRLHDLQVLLMHVVAVQAEPHSRSVARREALEDLARHVEDQCRHLHGRYVASMPALRDVTDAIRKSIVSPLAHPAPRVRTARMVKMSLNTTSTKRPPARTRASGR